MTFIGELIYPSATSAIIADPRLVALFDLWNAGRAASGAEMPSRASLPAEDLVRWWPALTLLEFEGPPADLRLRIRVHGGDIVSLDGVNGTGRLLADIFDRARFDKVKPGYMTVAIMNRPAYHKRESGDFQGYPVVYEKLLLPLAGPQGQLHQVLVCVYTSAPAREYLTPEFQARLSDNSARWIARAHIDPLPPARR